MAKEAGGGCLCDLDMLLFCSRKRLGEAASLQSSVFSERLGGAVGKPHFHKGWEDYSMIND